MRNIIAIIGALAIVAVFQYLASANTWVIFHPFWNIKATIIGSLIGFGLVVIMLLLEKRIPAVVRSLALLVGVLFIVSAVVTRYYAGIFVNSENFEPFAGQVWYIGYHVATAMFVPLAALTIRKLLPERN